MPDTVSTKKYCVFCGRIPEEKTKEHIIPKWLLELTGDPNRKGVMGGFLSGAGPDGRPHERPLSTFHFPACRACNAEFGKLEGRAKAAMLKVLANEEVDNEEITTLLDWFDKVRVGLWLAYNRLDRYSDIVDAPIHIKLGQALKDRLLFIYDFINDDRKSLQLFGATSPIFYIAPNAFILTVKDKLFLNAAADYLVSEKLGFAFGEFIALDGNSPDPVYRLWPGTGTVSYPVLPFRIIAGGTELYQAVASEHNVTNADPRIHDDLFHDPYLLRNGFQGYVTDQPVRVSRIFYKKPGTELALLAEDEKLSLQPSARMQPLAMGDVILSLFVVFQLRIWLRQMPTPDTMSPWQRTILPESIDGLIESQIKFVKLAAANMQ